MSASLSHAAHAVTSDTAEANAFSTEALIAANINPHTRLATDYLNHFNEAVMLLEMIPDMPDCFELFLEWAPLSYVEHFEASNFKTRELTIKAYQAADPAIRADFDATISTMTDILLHIGAAIRQATKDETRSKLASHAAEWIKPLITSAGAIINGQPGASTDVETIMASSNT